ncbi:MAG: TRAP transporter small permease [Lentimonas sp.]
MRLFSLLRSINGKLCDLLKVLLVTVFGLLVAVVLWGVASRYLLGDQASWSEELARLLIVWLALLGAALVSREDRHLGLDVLVRQWTEDVQSWSRIFVHVVVLIFASVVMAWGGWHLVSQRFELGQTLPALGIAKAWFYMALPVSGILTSMFSVEALIAAFAEPKESKEGAVK